MIYFNHFCPFRNLCNEDSRPTLPLKNFVYAHKMVHAVMTYSDDFVFIFLSAGTAAPMSKGISSTGTIYIQESDIEIVINHWISAIYYQ